jgi:hypothetical protein
MALALILGAGQAWATTCASSSVTISSSGTISANCSGSGLSVTLNNTSANNCVYTGSSHTPAISINGSTGAIEAWCAGAAASSGVSFAISAANSATVGTPLSFTVTRTKGNGTLGADTLALSSSLADSFFNPASVSFGSDEPSGASRTSRVVFTRSGQGTLSAASSGNSITPSGLITVSQAEAGTCSGIPVPPYAADAGAADSDMGDHRLIAASASERAAGTVRFTAPASGSLTFTVSAPATGYPALSSLDMTVSACPGDFSPSSSACKVPGTHSKGVKITVGAADCAVQARQAYYLNVRSVTPGRDVGLHLEATP